MRKYELTVVFPGTATAAKIKSTKDFVKKLVSAFDGTIEKESDWGRKDLAYTINGEKTGTYIHYEVELKPESVSQIETKLKLEDSVIRHLLIVKE